MHIALYFSIPNFVFYRSYQENIQKFPKDLYPTATWRWWSHTKDLRSHYGSKNSCWRVFIVLKSCNQVSCNVVSFLLFLVDGCSQMFILFLFSTFNHFTFVFLICINRWSAEFGDHKYGSPELYSMLAEYIYSESPELVHYYIISFTCLI